MPLDILVIDDDSENREILCARLEAAGYSVLQATDGLEGQRLAEQEKPRLIILDVMMPKSDGWQTCRKLKSDVRTQSIPVVMLTALSQNVDALRGWEAGAAEFLTKPCEPQELLQAVQKHIVSAS